MGDSETMLNVPLPAPVMKTGRLVISVAMFKRCERDEVEGKNEFVNPPRAGGIGSYAEGIGSGAERKAPRARAAKKKCGQEASILSALKRFSFQ
jgi:hypothetical protein